MKKLNLNLDALEVQSFSPDDDSSTSRGTVQGQGQAETDDPLPEIDDTIVEPNGTFFNCGTSCGLYYCDTNQSCDGGFTIRL